MAIPKLHKTYRAALLVLTYSVSAMSHASENNIDWPFCHPVDRSYPTFLDLTPQNNSHAPTQLEADDVQGNQAGQYQLNGNVIIWQGNQWMEAETATYHADTQQAHLTGNIRLGNLNLSAHGENGRFNLADNQGSIEDAQYYLFDQHGRGSADLITFESADFTRLKKAAYTTCDEGQDDWYIHARYVSLNKATGIGVAAPVYITFYNVPILFSPYLSFPIDDRRKSGFLFPSFGQSNETGTEISAPYYLNLAPNYDATITPTFIEHRGLLVDNEFRYLFGNNQGSIQAAYIANDKIYEADRSLYAINHHGRHSKYWSTHLDAKYVSDQDYLNDFDNSLSIAATTHLEERAELRYIDDNSQASVLLQGYQTLDKTIPEAQRPYRRLPQITYNFWSSTWEDRLHAQLDSEYVYFDREDRLLAHRLDLTPSISLPYVKEAGYITPKLSVRHTQYALDDTTAGQDDSHQRSIARATIDAGIFLERELSVFDHNYLQTLEPRLFYNYTPYQDQSDLPNFDTGLNTFSSSYLFLEDRFSGADRVGDTEHVTLAISSRLIDRNKGIERLRGSIGQMFYLKDRRVGLTGNTKESVSQSDIVADGIARISDHWQSRAELIWNHQTDVIDKGSFRLSYDAGEKRFFSSSYHWNRLGLDEQTNVAVSWPLSARWHFVGRHLFAHRDTRTVEAITGLAYNSCCWGISILHRRHQLSETDKSNESIMLQLHLKGLASIGNPIENIIGESVLGLPTN